MKIGSLCSGYGGLEEGVRAVLGGEVAWHSEIDPGAVKILNHRYPGVPNLGDMTAVDWSQVEPVDVITGGTPCQDVSAAGKRLGMRAGTRSGLWASMCDAIDIIRPSLVVWENVRGVLSAGADSNLECREGRLGDGGDGPVLRALGRVLGDLADIGYDASWQGLRAADVGAPHGRFRVFVTAWPIADSDRFGWARRTKEDRLGRADRGGPRSATPRLGTDSAAAVPVGDGGDEGRPEPARRVGGSDDALGRSPASADTDGDFLRLESVSERRGSSPAEPELSGSEPCPTCGCAVFIHDFGGFCAGRCGGSCTDPEWGRPALADPDGDGRGRESRASSRRDAVRTDQRNDPDRRDRGTDLSAIPTEAGPGEVLRDVRRAHGTEAIRPEPDARGHGPFPATPELFPELREHQGRSDEGRPPLASSSLPEVGVRDLRDDGGSARSSHRPGSHEQRPVESANPLLLVSPEVALAGGPTEADGGGSQGAGDCGCALWGQYAPAVHRWEMVLGRVAPPPTEPTVKGAHRLSARAVEWMQGLPAGWVTAVPGLTRNEQLKALGNGVVPQQAAQALRMLLPDLMEAAA